MQPWYVPEPMLLFVSTTHHHGACMFVCQATESKVSFDGHAWTPWKVVRYESECDERSPFSQRPPFSQRSPLSQSTRESPAARSTTLRTTSPQACSTLGTSPQASGAPGTIALHVNLHEL